MCRTMALELFSSRDNVNVVIGVVVEIVGIGVERLSVARSMGVDRWAGVCCVLGEHAVNNKLNNKNTFQSLWILLLNL